ncbi:hypothetical protein AGABI1DRAFT_133900 [Agaricus bisporus var. burnettii JB137-S8]|uniref:Uncharacterized protein n=1 Tax=Agaricus bisporus var. burnettii (strain JB137-S8 / ATCC MYA-4627 / FGSC 10392) TaxID=597362 RepID=K5WF52_AGABU|nr:uncharacterized protein AGABI1DRAFT_133900 [Agaricus bisporus var. burnettii JB137-S8]EKM73901.1 hypothetical protein AGABI1DRAFT_133900 [Agaricus bisporus var. burnettii JB137-S8]
MNTVNAVHLWEDVKCPANRRWLHAVAWQVDASQRCEWLSEDVRMVGEVDFQASALGAIGDHDETEQPLVALPQFFIFIFDMSTSVEGLRVP